MDATIDLGDLRCPLPVLRTKKSLAELSKGQVLEVLATDPNSVQDIPKFVELAKHRLIANETTQDGYRFLIKCDH